MRDRICCQVHLSKTFFRTVLVILVATIINRSPLQCAIARVFDGNFTEVQQTALQVNETTQSPQFLVSNHSESPLHAEDDDDDDDNDDDYDDDMTKDSPGSLQTINQSENRSWISDGIGQSDPGSLEKSSEQPEAISDEETFPEVGLNGTVVEGRDNETHFPPEGREFVYETYDYNSELSVPLYEFDPDEVFVETVRDVRTRKSKKKKKKKRNSRKERKRRTRKLPPVEPLPGDREPRSRTRTTKDNVRIEPQRRSTRIQRRPGKNRRIPASSSSSSSSSSSRRYFMNKDRPTAVSSQDRGSGFNESPIRSYYPTALNNQPSSDTSEVVRYGEQAFPSQIPRSYFNSDVQSNRNFNFGQSEYLKDHFGPQHQMAVAPLNSYPTKDIGNPASTNLQQPQNVGLDHANFDSPFLKQNSKNYYPTNEGRETDSRASSESSQSAYNSFKETGIADPDPHHEQQHFENHEHFQREYHQQGKLHDHYARNWVEFKGAGPSSTVWHRNGSPKHPHIYPSVYKSNNQDPRYTYTPKFSEFSSSLHLAPPDGSIGGIYTEFLFNFVPDEQTNTADTESVRHLPQGTRLNQLYFQQPRDTGFQNIPVYSEMSSNFYTQTGSNPRENQASEHESNNAYYQENVLINHAQ